METLIIIVQLILSLSILVVTHEFGHFMFAKLFGVKVSKFYMFFNPYFSIFKYQPDGVKEGTDAKEGFSFCKYTELDEEKDKEGNVTKKKSAFSLITYTRKAPATKSNSWWHNTDFGLGWLPLGGYCQIEGMIDETQDASKLAAEPQPWEFRSKKAWQRLLIMLGGVLINAITAPVIFWFLLYSWGESSIQFDKAPMGLEFHPVMVEAGFQNGDVITHINGNEVHTYKDIANTILFEDSCTVDVVRNGEKAVVAMPREFYRTILSNDVKRLVDVRIPTVVDSVVPGMAAQQAGILKGDSVIAVGDTLTPTFADVRNKLMQLVGSQSNIVVVRADRVTTDTLSIAIDSLGRIGFFNANPIRWIPVATKEFGFFEALPAGIEKGYDLLTNYLKQIPLLFSKEGAQKLGGFGTIAQLFPGLWDWYSFWFNTAFLAVILAVMNILPIPALDGGHVLFLLVEMVTGKQVPEKFLEVAQTVGMVLLFALMLYANGMDVIRAIF